MAADSRCALSLTRSTVCDPSIEDNVSQNFTRLKWKTLQTIVKCFLLALMMVTYSSRETKTEEISFEKSEIWIETQTTREHFVVEVAVTPKQRQQGLMFRAKMPRDMGMLFNFGDEIRLAMWMKNTLIPLDMLFVNKNGTIHRIVQNTIPLSLQTIAGGGPTLAVIELNAGVTQQLGIKSGDKVIHEIFNTN